jgi:hypothetical protein
VLEDFTTPDDDETVDPLLDEAPPDDDEIAEPVELELVVELTHAALVIVLLNKVMRAVLENKRPFVMVEPVFTVIPA